MKEYLTKEELDRYIRENNLEYLVEQDTKYDLVAHDLHCSCGKDTYRFFTDAKKALKQRGQRGKEKAVYKCSICGYFHLTSKDGGAKSCGHKKYDKHSHRGQNKTQKTMEYTSKIDKEIFENRKNWRGNKGIKNNAVPAYSTNTFTMANILATGTIEKLEDLTKE